MHIIACTYYVNIYIPVSSEVTKFPLTWGVSSYLALFAEVGVNSLHLAFSHFSHFGFSHLVPFHRWPCQWLLGAPPPFPPCF